MSLGNKKKVGIIQGLLHSPKLIILDEPTSGLDPLMQKKFFDIIKEENSRGATVLFSSHILSEVQKICNRVAIIKDGRIVKVQRVDELLQNSYKKVSFVLKNVEDATRINHNFCTNYEISENTVSFIYRGDCNLLIHEISNYDITTIEITEPSLEEVFMHYYAE
jgi:ABC-2 type transport system ATP-binding protein